MIGTKSTALRFGAKTPLWLGAFATSMSTNLMLAGFASGQTWPYYTSVVIATAQMFKQVRLMQLYEFRRTHLISYHVIILMLQPQNSLPQCAI